MAPAPPLGCGAFLADHCPREARGGPTPGKRDCSKKALDSLLDRPTRRREWTISSTWVDDIVQLTLRASAERWGRDVTPRSNRRHRHLRLSYRRSFRSRR